MSAKIQADILDCGVPVLLADIKVVAGGGDSARDIPLGNVLKLHGACAGDLVVGEVDGGQGPEVAALALVIALGPVAVGRPDPCGVGAVGICSIGVVLELTPVKRQRLSRDSAHNDAIEGAVVKLQLAQLAPGRGVQLIVEAHDVVEGSTLERHVGVSGQRQQQGCADLVDAGVTRDAAGDGAADEHNALAVGAVVLLTQIAVLAIGVELGVIGGLARGVVAHTVAQHAVGVIGVVAHGDIHGAVQAILRVDIRLTGHSAQLLQRVGVSLCAVAVSRSRLDYAIGAVIVGLDLEAVSAIVVGHLARKRTGRDVELILGSICGRCCGNIKLAADTGAIGFDGGLQGAAIDILLEQTLGAFGSVDLIQRHRCRLGHHDSCLLTKAVESSIGDFDLAAINTFRISLDTTGAGKTVVLDLGASAVVPQIVQAGSTVGELAVVKHRLAVLVVAHTIGESAVGVGHSVLRRTGIAQPCGKVVGAVAVVAAIGRIQLAQRQCLEADVDVVVLIRQNGQPAINADFGIVSRTHELHRRKAGQARLRHLYPAGSGHIDLAADFIGDNAVCIRSRRVNSIFQRLIAGAIDTHRLHHSGLRLKHRLARHGHRGVLVGVGRLLLVVPQSLAAVGAGGEARSRGLIVHGDGGAALHQTGVDLDGRLARNGSGSIKLGVLHRQIGLVDSALVVHQHAAAHAVEGAAVERDVLRAIRPDVVGARAGLIEGATVERLVDGIQEHHAVDGAVVVHQRVGVL